MRSNTGLALVAFGIFTTAFAAPHGQVHARNTDYSRYYDVQAHRGGRGQCVENTIASFAWGLISGATTLELDVSVLRASSREPTRMGSRAEIVLLE